MFASTCNFEMKNLIYFLLFLQWSMVPSQVVGQDLASQIFQQVRDSLQQGPGIPPGNNNPYNLNGMNNFMDLSHLQQDIEQQVQQSLLPVTAMTIKMNMINGVGGVTVIEDQNPARKLIVKDRIIYQCDGLIQGGTCTGALHKFEVLNTQDLCYANSYAVIDDKVCLSAGSLRTQMINNVLSCDSPSGAPTVLLTKQQYYELCGPKLPWEKRYTYYSDTSRSDSIKIPNDNPYVTCLNRVQNVCEFEGGMTMGTTGHNMNIMQNANSNWY